MARKAPTDAGIGRRNADADLPRAGPALWRTGMVGRHFEIDRELRQRAMGTQALQAVHARVAGKAGDARPDERGSNTQRMRIDLGHRIVIADCPTRGEERVSGGHGVGRPPELDKCDNFVAPYAVLHLRRAAG